jgi:fagellar hook-basal body proteins
MDMADDFSVLALSMQADMHKINSSSHNIANVNTPAYKRQVSFSEFLVAGGKLETSTIIDKSHGSLKLTNSNYDVAISGDGYFLAQKDGFQIITRNGQFSVDPQGFLTSVNGYRVQSLQGDILVGNQTLEINQQGDVLLNKEYAASLNIVYLWPQSKITPIHESAYLFSESNIIPPESNQAVLHQGYLENSNVDAREEMLNLVKTMRHFELQQKVLRSYDSMIDVGISDLGNF